MTRVSKTLAGASIEWLLLLGLWMAFVSQVTKDELLVGVATAAIGAVGDAIVKEKKFAKFKPKLSWLLLICWEPWYAIDGTWSTLKAIAEKLMGKPSKARFKAAKYDANGEDAQSAAKRALAVAYMTIPPNFIIVGIDRDKGEVLIHQVEPTNVPLIARKLGIHG